MLFLTCYQTQNLSKKPLSYEALIKAESTNAFLGNLGKIFGAFRWRYTGAINAIDAMLLFVRLGLLLARNPRCLSNPISITLCAIPKEFFKFASNGFLRYRRQTGNAYACAWLTNPFYKIVADLHVKFRIVTRLVGLFSNTRHHRAPGRIYITFLVRGGSGCLLLPIRH